MPTGTLMMSRHWCLRASLVGALLGPATSLVACSSSSAPTSQAVVAVTAISGSGQADLVGTELPVPIVITVTDAADAPVLDAPITFTATGGATVTDSNTVTNTAGQVTENVTLGHVAGIDTITATNVSSGASAVFIETAITGSAVTLVIDSGNGQSGTRGTRLPTPLSVLVEDLYGNPVAGTTVSWAASLGVLGAVSSVSDDNGRAQVLLTLAGIAGTDSVTATLPRGMSPVVFTEIGN